MTQIEKWRANADKLLSAAVTRRRNIKSVAGKVEDRFDAILSARQRGMAWKHIARALEDGDPIKVDAVQSAFKRICSEREITPSGQEPATATGTTGPKYKATPAVTAPQANLFNEASGRWVDDGE